MAIHPNSLKNLEKRSGQKYGEPKERRYLTVTETGWDATKAIAKKEFKLSVSELMEKIGRGELKIVANKSDPSSCLEKPTSKVID